jgi:hypothetical protein
MDQSSTAKLRLDQRLTGRRNWISKEELEKELAALPDVSNKIAEQDPEEGGEPAAESPASDSP